MKVVTTEQMRALDRRTMEEHGIPGEVLMETAGRRLAESVLRIAALSRWSHPRVQLLAGKGNNGGDAFVAARHLYEAGCKPKMLLLCAQGDLRGDAQTHFERMRSLSVEVREMGEESAWDSPVGVGEAPDILVDGILGTGSSGPAHGVALRGIQYINACACRALVVAIDLPSGLNGDTGRAEGEAVQADVTVTMGLPERGLVLQDALEYVGSVEVADIGIPEAYIEKASGDAELEFTDVSDVRNLFPRRSRTSHKGSYGHLLVLGGAREYTGAIALAAAAAARSGAGLVSVLTPKCIASTVAAQWPEIIVHECPETEIGSLSMSLWTEWRKRIDAYDAILIGPGMTRHNDTLNLIRQIIRETFLPLILDADAISVFAGQPHWLAKASAPVVLTPHPGELARLFGQDVKEIQADRLGASVAAARFTGATIVLKGGGTVVARDEGPVGVNLTGNPGMATGGTGDVLAGLLGGFVAQGLVSHEAAKAAVHIHGRSGDRAAFRSSQSGLLAGDVLREIPHVMREILGR